jgi:DNA-binding transcriptional regulator YhcF (GntR family)
MIQSNYTNENTFNRIARDIQQDILIGTYQPGDKLPTIREMKTKWKCTTGTVQHAYNQLAEQGLVFSKVGKGTFVSNNLNVGTLMVPLQYRKARMFQRAESFLLSSLLEGYSVDEIMESIEHARQHLETIS